MSPQRQYLEALVAGGDLTGDNLAFQGEPIGPRGPTLTDDGHDFVVPMPTKAGGVAITTDPAFDPNDPAWRQYGPDGRGPRTPFGCFRVQLVDEFVDGLIDSGPDAATKDWLEHQAKVFYVLNEWGDTNTVTNNASDDPDLDGLQKRCIDHSLDKAFWYGGSPCFVQEAAGGLRPLPCSVARLDEGLTPEDLLEDAKASLERHKGTASFRNRG